MVQLFTRRAGDAERLAAEAAASGADIVAACGGDGTLSEVVNGLLRHARGAGAGAPHQSAVAHIPLGTGCDFARTVGVARVDGRDTFHDALSRFGSRRTLMDVCSLTCTGPNGQALPPRYFVNVASCGASADAAATAGGAGRGGGEGGLAGCCGCMVG